VIDRLLDKHTVFKLCFNRSGDAYLIAKRKPTPLLLTLEKDQALYGNEQMRDALLDNAHRLINIQHGPLLCGIAFGQNEETITAIILICHHLVIDAVSWTILINDLNRSTQKPDASMMHSKEDLFLSWMRQSKQTHKKSYTPNSGKPFNRYPR
jgi:hypothetical protein